MTIPSDEYTGRLIVTWPAESDPIPGVDVTLHDADTGEQIVSALGMTVHVDLRAAVTAELPMLTDADGQYLRSGKPVRDDDGEDFRSGTFRWLVAEMRVAQNADPQPGEVELESGSSEPISVNITLHGGQPTREAMNRQLLAEYRAYPGPIRL